MIIKKFFRKICLLTPLVMNGIYFNPHNYDTSLGSIDTITLGQAASPFQIVVVITNWVLTFLGFAFLIFIIYAGWLWMTARGNEEQIKKSQEVLKRSVIGLVIILLSVSIAYLGYWLVVYSSKQADAAWNFFI